MSERDRSAVCEPLAPAPASRLLAWLSLATDRRPRTRTRPWLLIALILATIALGTWGFREVAFPDRLGLLQSIYHAAKLYTLDLGPVDGSGDSTLGPNWQILLAFVLAAMLVIRALLALVGGVVRRTVTRRLLSGHVIVCGVGVHGARLAQALSSEHDVVLIDPDADAPGMRIAPSRHEWRLVGNATERDVLLTAGARRASWLVAITGDDFTNSQIVSALLALGELTDGLHVHVQMEDPALARLLEHAGSKEHGRTVVTPFSPNAVAADALLERTPSRLTTGEERPLLEIRDGNLPYILLVGDHPLLDAIVLAALRRWRVRFLRELERPSGVPQAPMRVGIYGPGANARVDLLSRRWLPEPAVLEIESKDVELAGSISVADATWLAQRNHATHAFVACTRELDGVELSLSLSRVLGAGVPMTRVTTQPASLLDARLREHTSGNRHLATTQVLAIDELACDRQAMVGVAAYERLVRALEDDLGEQDARRTSAELFTRDHLGIHSNAMWRVVASESALARPLVAPVPISALVRASLSIDLQTPGNLRRAAEALAQESRPDEAFLAWCEYARHVNSACPESDRTDLQLPTGDEDADTLLRLRALTLGVRQTIATTGTPSGTLAGTRRVTIFAGPAASMTAESRSLLEPMILRALDGYEHVVLSGGTAVGLPGLIGEAARDLGLSAIGYVPPGEGDRSLYPKLRETTGASDFSVREPLAMWSDILAAGISLEDVRVVACPGGPIAQAEVLLARALGATVAWLDPAGEAVTTLGDALPFGAAGVLELPPDAMTLRAFVRWSAAPQELSHELRDTVARYLHADYRRKQRGRKQPGDAALAPWNQLLPALQRSNLDQAGDIPNKLAAIGKHLALPGEPLRLEDAQIELLAEIEHGRWNLERLRGGWQLGEREVTRLITSHLKPWAELDEETKDYDREAVRNIGPALADAGWGVTDVSAQ